MMSLVSLGLSCRGYTADRPEDAYTSFSRAVIRNEHAKAYAFLSKETQALLSERAKEISSASGGAIPNDPALLALASGMRSSALTEVKVIKQEGDIATIAVTAGGQTREQRMVKEGERWAVDLTEALKK
jgi:hypothetical protein